MVQIINSKQFKKIFFLIVTFILFPTTCFGAILYLEPAEGDYRPGDTFIVDVRIDTEEDCLNTVEANMSFSQEVLKATDFSQGNSILTVWLKSPKIDQSSGLISFTGGIPGGYCGRLPGEPGEPNLLGRIIFQPKEEIGGERVSAKIEFLESSQVLLNDGFGTPAKLTTRGAIFTILPEKAEVPKEEWQEELEKDKVPPEIFEIEISKDPTIFEGKYFIIFSTTDKQTGLDHYEVKEGKKDWEKRDSPYLLKDQSLQSIIKVKAVDKAGNERIAEYLPPYKITWLPWIILVAIIGLVIWWLIHRFTQI